MFVPILHKSLIFYTDELEAETPHINFPTKIIWRSLFTFFLLCTITSLLCWKIFYVAGVFFAVMSILYLVLLFRLCKVLSLSYVKVVFLFLVIALLACFLGIGIRWGFLWLWDNVFWMLWRYAF